MEKDKNRQREKLVIGGDTSLRPGHSLLAHSGHAGLQATKPKMDAAAVLGASRVLSGSMAGSSGNLLSRLDAFLPKMKEANTAVSRSAHAPGSFAID